MFFLKRISRIYSIIPHKMLIDYKIESYDSLDHMF